MWCSAFFSTDLCVDAGDSAVSICLEKTLSDVLPPPVPSVRRPPLQHAVVDPSGLFTLFQLAAACVSNRSMMYAFFFLTMCITINIPIVSTHYYHNKTISKLFFVERESV